jgi:hypothetical protein
MPDSDIGNSYKGENKSDSRLAVSKREGRLMLFGYNLRMIILNLCGLVFSLFYLCLSSYAQSPSDVTCSRIGSAAPNWGGSITELNFTSSSNPFNRSDLTFVPTTLSVSHDTSRALYVAGSVIRDTGALGIFVSRHHRDTGAPDPSFNAAETPGFKIRWTGLSMNMTGWGLTLIIDEIAGEAIPGRANIFATGVLTITPPVSLDAKPVNILVSYDVARNRLRTSEEIGSSKIVAAHRLGAGNARDRVLVRNGWSRGEFSFNFNSPVPIDIDWADNDSITALETIPSPIAPSSLLLIRALTSAQNRFELEQRSLESTEPTTLWKKAITLHQRFKPLAIHHANDRRLYLMGEQGEANREQLRASIYRYTSQGDLDNDFGSDDSGRLLFPIPDNGQSSRPLDIHIGPRDSSLPKRASIALYGGSALPKIAIYNVLSGRLIGEREAPATARSIAPASASDYDEQQQALYTLWSVNGGATITKTCLHSPHEQNGEPDPEPTKTQTPTATQTKTQTPTLTPTLTTTPTPTATPTLTLTPTATITNTSTRTPTRTATPTSTSTLTHTPTLTPTPTHTIPQAYVTVEQYAVLELSFESAADFSNPNERRDPFDYDTNRVFLKLYPPGSTQPLKGPTGSEAQYLGFWNGGKEWKVRLSIDTIGRGWRYTLHNTMGDAKLTAISGVIDVVAPTGTTLSAQHGGIVDIDPATKKLAYRDGTPFFWLGDRWSRFPKGFNTLVPDPTGSHKPPIPFLDAIIKSRKDDGFTVMQTHGAHVGIPIVVNGRTEKVSGLGAIEDRTGARLQYWQNFDLNIQKLTDAGFVVLLGYGSEKLIDGLIKEDDTRSPSLKPRSTAFKQLFQYMLARYGAYSTSFMMTQEFNNYNFADYNSSKRYRYPESVLTERENLLNAVGSSLKRLDPYGRAITIQFATYKNSLMEDHATLYNPAEEWPWISYYIVQAGQRVGIPSRGETKGTPGYTSAIYDRLYNSKLNPNSLYTKPWVEGDANWDQMLQAYNYTWADGSPAPRAQGTPSSTMSRFRCDEPYEPGWADITIGPAIHGESNSIAMQSGGLGLSYGTIGLFNSTESVAEYQDGKHKWGLCKTMYNALDFPSPPAFKIIKDIYTNNLNWQYLKQKSSFLLREEKLETKRSPLVPAIKTATPSAQGYGGDEEGYRISIPGGWGTMHRNQRAYVEKPENRYRLTVYKEATNAQGTPIPGEPGAFVSTKALLSIGVTPNVTPFVRFGCEINYSCATATATPTVTLTRTPTSTATLDPEKSLTPSPTPTATPTATATSPLIPTPIPLPSNLPLVLEIKRDDLSIAGQSTVGEEYMIHFASLTSRGGYATIDVDRSNTSYVYYGLSSRTGACWISPREVQSDATKKIRVRRPPSARPEEHFFMVVKRGTLGSVTTTCE